MNKNMLKRVFSALAVSAVAVSATGMTSFAANYCDKQDNQEAPYDSSVFESINPNDVDLEKVDESEVKAKITVDKVVIDTDELAKKNYQVNVSVNISDVAGKANNISTHISHDTRLKLIPVSEEDEEYVEIGSAIVKFQMKSQFKMADGTYTLQIINSNDTMKDGSLFNLNFEVPKDAKAGDLYPVGIDYMAEKGTSNDLLWANGDHAALMDAWTWMNGVTNGYIKIEAASTTTVATTTKTPVVTTTTKATPAPATTTKATPAPAPATTTKATPAPAPATTTKATPAPVVTTAKPAQKPSNNNTKPENPPTGVAGVGLAAAGLALAVGTAFVLRKKED